MFWGIEMRRAPYRAALKYSFCSMIVVMAFASVGQATPVTFDTISHNFQLSNGGGGTSASLGGVPAEVFSVDFSNDISVPGSYSANLTSLTTAGFSAATTRFGNNSSWRTVTIADDGVDGGADDATDSAIINAASALGRYQLAAYLVSQYNLAAGNNAANNGIQTAIWEILNPSSYSLAPFGGDPSDALEQAALWYATTSAADRDVYLAAYRIVSDSTMTNCGLVQCGGFQEQITQGQIANVPEPSTLALYVAGVVVLFSRGRRFHTDYRFPSPH